MRAVCKAIRRRRNTLAYLALVIAMAVSFYQESGDREESRTALRESGTAAVIIGCNRDFRLNQRIRGVFVNSMATARDQYADKSITKGEFDDRMDFYKSEITKTKLPDCRHVKITDIRGETLDVAPLYEGSPFECRLTKDELKYDDTRRQPEVGKVC